MAASGLSGNAWANRFPVYQIDFQAVASGKHIAATKRKVRWRFGFPNKQALDAGRTGVDCRGEEHDVVIIWSITSGKRQVYFDGTEVHFSTNRSSTFQYSWSSKGNHVIKVLAHAAPPVSPTPGFRQYDLFIDGQSFFTMPKAYELGLKGPISAHDRVPGNYSGGYGAAAASPSYGYDGGISAPHSRDEEDAALQAAINASLQESQQYLASKTNAPRQDQTTSSAPPVQTVDLMDFAGQPENQYSSHASPPQYGGPPPGQYGAPPAAGYGSPPPQYGQYPPQPQTNGYQQSPGYGSQPQQTRDYGAQPQNNYQYAQPSSSNALVPSNAPSQPYALPQGNQSYQAPAPATPSYAGSYKAPAPATPSYSAPAPAIASYGAPAPGAYGSAPPQQQQQANFFGQQPVDQFAPAPQGQYSSGLSQWDDPFAPKPPPPPTRDDITNSILGAYGSSSKSQQQQSPQSHQGQNGHGHQPGQPSPQENGPGKANGSMSMNGYASFATEQEEKPLSDFEKAMKRLVNVDRIDEPAEEEFTLTMKQKEEKKKKDGKSKGLPPAGSGMVGSNATLADISKVKGNSQKTGEGVMKPPPPNAFHPDAVNAGALVVHGQGPPPIQRGFGLGYGAPPPNYQQYARW